MPLADFATVIVALVAVLIVCELPALATLNRAKLRCRQVRYMFALSWIVTVLNTGLALVVGSIALKLGGKFWIMYCAVALSLLSTHVLSSLFKVRAINRVAAEAQRLDANPVTGS